MSFKKNTKQQELRNRKHKIKLNANVVSSEEINVNNITKEENEMKEKQITDECKYDSQFFYELKYTMIRCLLIIVIFFILQSILSKYILDPLFNRGSYSNIERLKQKNKMDILNRICPKGALECNVDFNSLKI